MVALRRQRGLSLLELLMAVTIVAIAAGAIAKTVVTGVQYETRFVKTVDDRNARTTVEERLRGLLEGAVLGGTNRAFVSPAPGLAGVSSENGILSAGSSSVVFTTSSDPLPIPYLQATGTDFDTLNQRFGPRGGVTEVGLSTTPVGDAGLLQGLFLRTQRPPDSNPAQGGEEMRLSETIKEIRFEFYDGNEWVETWDSRSDAQKDKLPTAVRVTYVYGEEKQPRLFIVRLRFSTGGTA